MAIIRVKRGSGIPTGLTLGEPAFDFSTRRLYIGITSGSELVGVAGGGVHTFNGLTGAVTGVTTGTANTFVALQSFTNGISSAGGTFSAQTRFLGGITVSNGATFETNVAVNSGNLTTSATTGNVFNTTATTLNIGGAATTTTIAGVASGLTLNIANTTHFSGEKIINIATNVSGGGIQTITIGQGGGRILSTTSGLTFGSVSGSSVTNIVGTVCNITPPTTFNGLLTASAGISASGGTFRSQTTFLNGVSASGGITFNSSILANGYRTSLSIFDTKTAGFTLGASDDGKIILIGSNATTTSINCPTGLPVGFQCDIIRRAAASQRIRIFEVGTTIESKSGNNPELTNSTFGGEKATITQIDTNIFAVSGDI